MLQAKVTIEGINDSKTANRLLSKFQSAYDREAHFIRKHKGHRKYWLVGDGYIRGTYQKKKANGEYEENYAPAKFKRT